MTAGTGYNHQPKPTTAYDIQTDVYLLGYDHQTIDCEKANGIVRMVRNLVNFARVSEPEPIKVSAGSNVHYLQLERASAFSAFPTRPHKSLSEPWNRAPGRSSAIFSTQLGSVQFRRIWASFAVKRTRPEHVGLLSRDGASYLNTIEYHDDLKGSRGARILMCNIPDIGFPEGNLQPLPQSSELKFLELVLEPGNPVLVRR